MPRMHVVEVQVAAGDNCEKSRVVAPAVLASIISSVKGPPPSSRNFTGWVASSLAPVPWADRVSAPLPISV